ncbi:unnamed protein product [Urochloa decumbens]|uniref:BTB domain-containing protein n=1 Tax=Urochloa decumbens TaxID=240449 RepID=A0ABC9C8J7_9POAL
MESGFIELKLDCSEETRNGPAAGEVVFANNAIAAGRHIHLRSGSKAEQELSINCDLLRQCSLGDGADVSFLVGGHKFHAHRAVLAAGSPAFRDLFFGPAAAAASMDGIRVEGVKPETFRFLLRYMYAGALPGDHDEIGGAPTAEMLRNLVAAADAYGMERLKLACAQKLWDYVSAETVAATLGFAMAHDCPELKKKCMDFLTKEENLCRAALSEGYVQLMQSFPSVLDELRARLCSGLQSSDYKDFCSLF